MALFDGFGDITGHIYANTIIRNMKGATYAKSYELLQDAYRSVNKGIGGFTAKDAKQLAKIVDAMGKQYGISNQTDNVSYMLKFMANNDRLKDKVSLNQLNDYINGISPKALTGSITGDIKQGKATHTYGNKNTKGTLPNASSNNTATSPTTTNTTTTTTPTYTGGGSGSGINDAYIGWLQNKNEELDRRIYELEHPKVMTADELAALHGIDYNEQHILDEYNKKTNEYYQNAIDEYYNLRNNLVGQASRNNQRTVNDYLGEWDNAVPTAARRGELAANALSAYMNSNYALNTEDYNLAQAQNGLRSEWAAELAANPNTARQQYNAMGTTLAGLAATYNQSDVKQYIDQLDAYSQMYAANRAISAAAAQGVASQYAGLANAAATNASTSAKKYNSWEQLYNYFRNNYGSTDKQASTAVTNNLQQSSGINKNT